ncbi:hypothetical protein SB775_33685, partial [Peribacillus sp. SIMBA_075]|uniref:hypothetical protein n=1 Tax=Peribacillus sp. SIMBA_075 TaxID=3085813 RepID=UPI003978B959
MKLLREQGRVDSTGATSLIVYHATGPGRRNESPRNGADAGMEEKPSAAPAGATAAAPTSPLANVATP